eukprot:CAMPEP_0177385462 /NCGR_PEP_ID=MMETSP0368-20130122/50254_1 /TAXON_ID=447022 ORGANISM="Scrippsiella hangoei-like, Strain SHHI-4" /NCGR_SAMPLE_ID=MMETSP0368 /ASSEMBLY_ACC=CAM_ASM_000363 /LENGTH=119 /DNA_ID=CAMNT_0018850227 /DNA_START=128 /DNA_END=483 /DNA_ORIENTATION=+
MTGDRRSVTKRDRPSEETMSLNQAHPSSDHRPKASISVSSVQGFVRGQDEVAQGACSIPPQHVASIGQAKGVRCQELLLASPTASVKEAQSGTGAHIPAQLLGVQPTHRRRRICTRELP